MAKWTISCEKKFVSIHGHLFGIFRVAISPLWSSTYELPQISVRGKKGGAHNLTVFKIFKSSLSKAVWPVFFIILI